jgi:hypothetical protein
MGGSGYGQSAIIGSAKDFMTLRSHNVLDVAREPEREVDETSDERFDRAAFARHALALLRPPRTTVAISEGARRMHVAGGRVWGGAPGQRWAMLAIPRSASRRAITLAVAELASTPRPWALDVLLGPSDDASAAAE